MEKRETERRGERERERGEERRKRREREVYNKMHNGVNVLVESDTIRKMSCRRRR